jgi:hypothetical protein
LKINLNEVAWRTVGESTVVVRGSIKRAFRLNRDGTEIWRSLVVSSDAPAAESIPLHAAPMSRPETVAAFISELTASGLLESDGGSVMTGSVRVPRSRLARQPLRPRCLPLADMAELVEPVSAVSDLLVKQVGDGFLLCAPDGSLSLLTGERAILWDLLASGRRPFVELVDGLCDRAKLAYEDAEHLTHSLLRSLSARQAVVGLDKLARFRRQDRNESAPAPARRERELGNLEPMEPRRVWPRPQLGRAPVVSDGPPFPAHVAIVCQYGISGFAAGVEPYVQRCITRLRRLEPDLIILSGGGRHGLTTEREAESAVERYRAQLPQIPLWLEKYSATTWENLQNSLEMLLVRSALPKRISVIGDRTRAEKLRLACVLAKRRFPQFADIAFRVVALPRHRSTWRDTRTIQLFVGCVQVLRESRGARLAVRTGGV